MVQFKIPVKRQTTDEQPSGELTSTPTERVEPSHPFTSSSSSATIYADQLLPDEIVKALPVSARLYSVFEEALPGSGHMGALMGHIGSSIATDERRQVNVLMGAKAGEGKTEIFEKFARVGNVNFMDSTTYADYLVNFCGKYLDPTSPLGKDKPRGVELEKFKGGMKINTAHCVDYISQRFDYYHAGENLSTIAGFQHLLVLWMSLIEKGHYSGGNRITGRYNIGEPIAPIKHGAAIGCTVNDLTHSWFKQVGFLSRCLVVVFQKNPYEHLFIQQGRDPPYVKLTYYDFSPEVAKVVQSHYSPYMENKIGFDVEDYAKDTGGKIKDEILQLIIEGRQDEVPTRATNDRISLLKASPLLNGRKVSSYYDLIFTDALLMMCKAPIRYADASGKDRLRYFGDRLSFQLQLRWLLYRDEKKVKDDIRRIFKDWDGSSCVYPDEYVDRTFKMLRSEKL